MANKKPIDLSFPVKGLDANWAYKSQPEGTTPDCLNVRPYDVLGSRLRGGQRGGHSKYVAAAVNGTSPIRALGHVTTPSNTAVLSVGGTLLTETCTVDLSSTTWQNVVSDPASHAALTASTYYTVTSGRYQSATAGNGVVYKTAVPAAVVVQATVLCNHNGTQYTKGGVLFRCASNGSGGLIAANYGVVFIDAIDYKVRVIFPDGTTYTSTAVVAPTQTTHVLRVEDDRSIVRVYVDGVLFITTAIVTSGSTNNYVGVFAQAGGGATPGYVDTITISTGLLQATPPVRRLVVVSGGNIYSGLPGGTLALATSGTGAISPVRTPRMVEAFGAAYFANGLADGYKIFTAANTTVTGWQADCTAFSATSILPIGKVGVTPTGNGCSLIALYRGRLVLSGLFEEPHNWFMSRAGKPLDWDYGGTVDATMPVAGNNSVAGLVGDVITALVPYGDDLMVMGCAQSIWIMRGDPAAGGVIDNISYQVGITGQEAATWDPFGILYFYGSGGLWRMTPGQSVPESLTNSRLATSFGAIDPEIHRVVLAWGLKEDGLHIYLVPTDAAQPTTSPVHWFWDRRTDSFWKDQIPVAQGPSAVHYMPADQPDDRAVLLGGWDSYVRRVDLSKNDDDGTTINSRVRFGPITPGGVHVNARLSRITPILGASSSPTTVRIFAAQSPEEAAVATTPAWAKQVSTVDRYSIPRIGGNSVLFEFENDDTAWVTGTNYIVGDQVVVSGVPYACIVAHLSTTAGAHPTPPDNVTDWSGASYRTWALEGISAILDITGRTRHGRI